MTDRERRQPVARARQSLGQGKALLVQLAFTLMATALLVLWWASQPGQEYVSARMECLLNDNFLEYQTVGCGRTLVNLEPGGVLTPELRVYPKITVSDDEHWFGTAPLENFPLPPQPPKTSVAKLAQLPRGGSAMIDGTELTAAQRCLSLNVYWEARNQPYAGQLAVAQVTMNRVNDRRFPNDVCEVVYDHKQFSWYWDGKTDRPRDSRAWSTAVAVASAAMAGSGTVELDGVTHYHAVYSQPYWKDHMRHVATIGDHIFYSEQSAGRSLQAAIQAD